METTASVVTMEEYAQARGLQVQYLNIIAPRCNWESGNNINLPKQGFERPPFYMKTCKCILSNL